MRLGLNLNADILGGNWLQFLGKTKERYGKLTDDDLKASEGQFDKLVGAIQKNYGIGKEQAENELTKLYKSMSDGK